MKSKTLLVLSLLALLSAITFLDSPLTRIAPALETSVDLTKAETSRLNPERSFIKGDEMFDRETFDGVHRFLLSPAMKEQADVKAGVVPEHETIEGDIYDPDSLFNDDSDKTLVEMGAHLAVDDSTCCRSDEGDPRELGEPLVPTI